MTISLENKKILVTGGSRGIGKAICEQLHASGATVCLHYSRSEEQAKKIADQLGDRIHLLKADLTDVSQTSSLVDQAISAMHGLDAIVNNAGVSLNADIHSDNWENAWNTQFDVNAKALGIVCKEGLKHFVTQKTGHIVNIASRAAFRGDTAEYMAYAASKGAVVAFTRSIARAYGKQGIKAFIVAPGFTHTDMAQDFIDTYGEDFVKNDLALDELTRPEHVAPTVAFLLSGLADHLTGTTIDINAGSYVH